MMHTPNMTLQNGRYRILHLIKQGGMGTVYEAHDARLNHKVAIKEALVGHSALRLVFEKEGQRLARLRHTALPKVIDHFTEGQSQYLVMEFVDGQDLAEMLFKRQAPFSVGEVLDWAYKLLDVLAYLHQRGIIHRDIKPANIKLTVSGEPILLDFGLAKGGLTQSSGRSVVGFTLNYASPEQMMGKPTDSRSDLYSFGATLYTLLTNEIPADALLREQAFKNNAANPVRPVHILNPQVPIHLSQAITKAMALEPAWRPSDANALRAILQSTPSTFNIPSATPISQPPKNILPTSQAPRPFQPVPISVHTAPSPSINHENPNLPKQRLVLWGGLTLMGIFIVCLFVLVKANWPLIGSAILTEATPSPTILAISSPLPATETVSPTASIPSATSTPVATLTHEEFLIAASQWPVIFIDDFDDNSGDWRDIDDITDPKVNISFEGRLQISITTGEESILETFYREAVEAPSDFLLTVDAAAVNVDACEYGLVFRGDINKQYYLFVIRGNERLYQIRSVTPSEGHQTIYSNYLPANIQLPNSLTVIGEEDYYRFYINKTFVYEMSHDQLTGDRIGLETFLCPQRTAEFIFDKFELHQP